MADDTTTNPEVEQTTNGPSGRAARTGRKDATYLPIGKWSEVPKQVRDNSSRVSDPVWRIRRLGIHGFRVTILEVKDGVATVEGNGKVNTLPASDLVYDPCGEDRDTANKFGL